MQEIILCDFWTFCNKLAKTEIDVFQNKVNREKSSGKNTYFSFFRKQRQTINRIEMGRINFLWCLDTKEMEVDFVLFLHPA